MVGGGTGLRVSAVSAIAMQQIGLRDTRAQMKRLTEQSPLLLVCKGTHIHTYIV